MTQEPKGCSPFYNKNLGPQMPISNTGILFTTVGILALKTLTPKATNLLFYLLQDIQPEPYYVYLNKEQYMSSRGIASKTTISNAITELRSAGFITNTTTKDAYWTNPYYFHTI